MSALDPSAPGLPLAIGGGGASLPVSDPADLLSGATPERFVVIDDAGEGALITAAQAASLIGGAPVGRRPALPDFGLLWECNETTGDFVNTGTLEESGNLTVVGSGTSRSQLGPTTVGRGARFDGTTNGYAKGAEGITPGAGSDVALTMFAVAVLEAAAGSRKDILSRSFALAELPAPYVAATISVISGTTWLAKLGISGTYVEVTSNIPYVVGRQHIFGVTYDGAYVCLWLDGVLAKREAHPGTISWGSGTGLWWLGSNPSGGASTSLIARAGAANVVWDSAEWGEFVQRTNGNWIG